MMSPAHFHPAPWLQELARLKHGRWAWGKAIRAAIGVGLPLVVGMATDKLNLALWIAMAAMIMSAGEGVGTYRSLFRQAAISGTAGAIGFLAGYLMVLPYPLVIAIMMALSFLGGIVSSYGMRFSLASMQALLMATIAIGMPQVGSYWQPALLYLAGIGFYALLLGAEAMIDRRRPERQMLSELLLALAKLADIRMSELGKPGESRVLQQQRRVVTDQSNALYSALIGSRRQGRTLEATKNAAILDATDATFSAILGATEAEGASLTNAAAVLRRMAAAVLKRQDASGSVRIDQPDDIISHSIRHLAESLWSGGVVPKPDRKDQPQGTRPGLSALAARFALGPEVVTSSLALALSMGIAFSMRYLIDGSHWYWVPLTVAIVVKPDLGSIFARAILRAAGTVVGVVIGTALLILLPKGPVLIIAIAALAALMFWAKQISYAVQTLVLTPLMLVLLDLIAPSVLGADYAGQRLVDTLLGGAIAIVFGYFIWPRSHERQLAASFGQAMVALADFLTVACSSGAGSRIGDTRRNAYAQLSSLRATLQRSMAEPGTAGTEAVAWFPVVAGAERLCDRITAYAADCRSQDPVPAPDVVEKVATQMRALGQSKVVSNPGPSLPATDFLGAIAAETERLGRMLGGVVAGDRVATVN